MNSKKGFCIYFVSHRGIGKIVEESKDFKKLYKQIKDNKSRNDIFCTGCGPDMKTANKKYNENYKKEQAKNKMRKLREKKQKLNSLKKKQKKQVKKSKKLI
jgi:hypothetical protein